MPPDYFLVPYREHARRLLVGRSVGQLMFRLPLRSADDTSRTAAKH
jgi:hypothetical protein